MDLHLRVDIVWMSTSHVQRLTLVRRAISTIVRYISTFVRYISRRPTTKPLQKSVLEIMSKLYQLALTKNERSYRDLWRNCPPRFLQCRYEIATPSRLAQNLVMSSPINRGGTQSSDTSSGLFCEVTMNSPKFALQMCMELNLFYRRDIVRNKKKTSGYLQEIGRNKRSFSTSGREQTKDLCSHNLVGSNSTVIPIYLTQLPLATAIR